MKSCDQHKWVLQPELPFIEGQLLPRLFYLCVKCGLARYEDKELDG